MSGESFVNSEIKQSKREKYYQLIKDGVNNFIEAFTKDNSITIPEGEVRKGSSHIEDSYLCHGIWARLIYDRDLELKMYSDKCFTWKCEEAKDNSNDMNMLLFHFDIMHNPKKTDKNRYSCGLFKYCNDDLRKQMENIYHSIGNMAPIPWFRVDGDKNINGQLLHKAVDERWDIFLQILKDNWKRWNKKASKMTFRKYMILTGQQMYYENVFKKIKEDNEEITLEKIKGWNKMIKPESKLISFSVKKDSEKEDSEKEYNRVVEDIIKIIKIRCQVICLLLNKNGKRQTADK